MALTVFSPRRFLDARGWFSETYNAERLAEFGIMSDFCQDNHSMSRSRGTLRGLHFQSPSHAQAKLARCIRGRIFDVVVDIRQASPTFGEWIGVELSAENGKQLFIPVGFAHGFLTLEPDCEVIYKVNAFYDPDCEGGIAWDDPEIAITWPALGCEPILSEKDACLPKFSEFSLDFPYNGCPLKVPDEVEL